LSELIILKHEKNCKNETNYQIKYKNLQDVQEYYNTINEKRSPRILKLDDQYSRMQFKTMIKVTGKSESNQMETSMEESKVYKIDDIFTKNYP